MDLFAKCYAKEENTSNPIINDILEKIRILKNQLAAGVQDKGPNDIYAQVTGKDKGGRARMYGYQATISDVYGNKWSRGSDHRLDTEFENTKRIVEVQSKQIQELLRLNKQIMGDHTQFTRASSASTSRNSMPSDHRRTSSINPFLYRFRWMKRYHMAINKSNWR